jgi:hypothetical protein
VPHLQTQLPVIHHLHHLLPTPIKSVSLQAKNGIVISSDYGWSSEDMGYLNWPLQGIIPDPSKGVPQEMHR